MAFDPSKDKTIWQANQMSADGLIVAIKQYGNYPPKIDFSRLVKGRNGQPDTMKGAGRFSKADWEYLKAYANELEGYMAQIPIQPQQN